MLSDHDMQRPLPGRKPAPVPVAEGYVIHGFLGRGSSGMVWRATQEGTLREVALKFLSPWVQPDRAGLRFAREAEIAAALEHENIVRVFDRGGREGAEWLAMELVDGPTVAHWAAQQNPSLKVRVELFRGICAGVRHAHQRGVIHRDLKPGNVLVTAEGKPKVADFGLACWQEEPSLEVTLTQQGEVFGSLAWMPPEQAAGRWEDVDTLSDVYALGAIFFSLLAGQPPLDGTLPPAALLAAAQCGERCRLRDMGRDIPWDLAAVVDKCLSLEKSRRYQSVAELEAEVGRWLAGEPVRARAASPGYWLGKKIRRHWAAVAMAALLTVAAAVVAWSYFAGKRKLHEQRQAALVRESAQAAKTLSEAQELVTQLLVEMKPKLQQGGGREWVEEAEKRVAAFPWSLGGGTGTYDPRPFRARAAMAMADDLAKEWKWGNALLKRHEAIHHLQALVRDYPDVPAYLEELGQARLEELSALLRLGYHKEAVTAAQQALAAFTPPPGERLAPALLRTAVERTGSLTDAVMTGKGRLEEVRVILMEVGKLISPDESTAALTAEEAGWHASLLRQRAAVTAVLSGAAGADALALQAVEYARRGCQLAGGGESAAHILVEALAMEAEVARELDDRPRAIQCLQEGTGVINQRKSNPPHPSQSVSPFKRLALAWERHALWMEKCGDLPAATSANDQAIALLAKMQRAKQDWGILHDAAGIFLRNARIFQQLQQPESVLRSAAGAASRFEKVAREKLNVRISIHFDWAESALMLAEMNAAPHKDGRTWVEIVQQALSLPREREPTLEPELRGILKALEQRLGEITGKLLPSPPAVVDAPK